MQSCTWEWESQGPIARNSNSNDYYYYYHHHVSHRLGTLWADGNDISEGRGRLALPCTVQTDCKELSSIIPCSSWSRALALPLPLPCPLLGTRVLILSFISIVTNLGVGCSGLGIILACSLCKVNILSRVPPQKRRKEKRHCQSSSCSNQSKLRHAIRLDIALPVVTGDLAVCLLQRPLDSVKLLQAWLVFLFLLAFEHQNYNPAVSLSPSSTHSLNHSDRVGRCVEGHNQVDLWNV